MKNVLTELNKNFILMMALFLSFTLVTSCGDDEPMDADPANVVANFTAQVDANNSLAYTFTNNSVVNGITDTSFDASWDFGGDGTSTDASMEVSYTFSTEGSYDVSLTITAADGTEATTIETIDVTAPKNRYAVITDTDDGDTGELRLAIDSIANGRVTFMYRVAEGPVDMDIQDGFINVSGSSTTGDFALVEVRLKDNAPHEYREGASDATIAAAMFPEGAPNVWVPIMVSWSADGTNAPTFSLSIDGQVISTDAVSTTNGGVDDEAGHLAAVKDGARNFQWKYAGNSAVSDGVYHIDDIVIYSSDSGTEVEVFNDNFQARSAGDDLNPGVNVDSPYHENSSDASVGEDG